MPRPTAIVVGSGAGGCMAARELSTAYDVTLLEQGFEFKRFAAKLSTLEPLRRAGLMFDERLITMLYPQMRVMKAKEGLVHVQGRALGGTAHLATGNRVRCDADLRALGLDLDAEFAELEVEAPGTTAHQSRWNKTTRALFDVFANQGLDPFVMPKFDKCVAGGAPCVSCGRCVLGCPANAKWTPDLLLADCPNVTVVTDVKVERLDMEGSRAACVVVRKGLATERLAADLVVLSAGGLGTAGILSASGVQLRPTVFDDPVICLAAKLPGAGMDRQVPMPFASQQDGYILSPYMDFLSFFFNKDWREKPGDIVSIMVKYADSGEGSFDGRTLSMPYTAHDEALVASSLEKAMGILSELGIRPEDTYVGTLNAGHPGGSLALDADSAATLHDSRLPKNVYVADASLLPKSMGNPPILTIMALAKRVARVAIQALA